MKHLFTMILFLSFVFFLKSQTVFDSFDSPIESNYTVKNGGLSDSSKFFYSLEDQIVSEGEGALRLEYMTEAIADWGGGCLLQLQNSDASGLWDFSGYDTLSVDFFNKVASSHSGRALMQILLFEGSDVDDVANSNMRAYEWWYSFHKVLDRGEGWYTIKLPLEDVGSLANQGDGGSGFWLTGWDGSQGNGTLDLDKIRTIVIGISIEGPFDNEIVRGEFIMDNLVLKSSTTSVSIIEETPGESHLGQNYPNPFSQETNIRINITENENPRLNVFDQTGKKVAELIDGKQDPGTHIVTFNARDLPSGVYYYQFQDGSIVETRKLIVFH